MEIRQLRPIELLKLLKMLLDFFILVLLLSLRGFRFQACCVLWCTSFLGMPPPLRGFLCWEFCVFWVTFSGAWPNVIASSQSLSACCCPCLPLRPQVLISSFLPLRLDSKNI